MSARWRVELGSDAARALRELSAPSRRAAAVLLDRLEKGLPPEAEEVVGSPGAYRIPSGTHRLLVVVRPEASILLVVRIDVLGADAPREVARALPWPGRIRSRASAWAGDLVQDLSYALRAFRRSPGFTAAVLLTLALGFGGTTAILETLHTVYRAPLPFHEGDRLLRLRSFTGSGGEERVYNMPDRDALLIRDEARTLSEVALMRPYDLTLVGGDLPERARGVGVSAGWTDLLGVRPVMGRSFTPDEEAAGADAGVALISHALWQRSFQGDPNAVGGLLRLERGTLRVVGVMPPRFLYPYDADVWTPFRPDPTNYAGHDLNVAARMADGVGVDEVRAEMDRLYRSLEAESPGTAVDDGVHVATVRADFIREDGRIIQALMVAVAFLLLLACVNVANLLTARFVARDRELGVRAALGAGRGRQFRQLLTETVVLFVAGGGLGLLVAGWLSGALSVLVPDNLRVELGMGGGGGAVVLAASLGLTVVAGLLFGAAAAVRASRPDLRSVLHGGGRGASVRGGRLQDGLVVAELALCVVLLVGAGVMVDHFRRLREADLGYDVERLYTFRIPLQQERYGTPDARAAVVRGLEERLAGLPGVVSVGMTSVNPLCCGDWGAPIEVEGMEPTPDAPPIIIHHRYATPAFFETMGIDVMAGSLFDASAGPGSAPTVVVDQAMARRFWPGRDPVGRRVRVARDGYEWRTVVGVVETVHQEGDYTEAWYLPFYQEPLGRSNEDMHVMLRVRSEAAVDAARRAVREVDPNLPAYEVAAMAGLRDDLLAQDRLGGMVSLGFAGFGLLLATFGLYGLLSWVVGRRSREIGTRIAMGASRGEVLRMILRRAAVLLGAGTIVGLLGALGLNVVLSRIVQGVELAGPGILAPLMGLLVLVVGVAALVPALRASRVDPVTVLQGE